MTSLAGGLLLADSDAGKGSPIGLLVVLLLIVAVYFLYRSMNRHIRKIPGRFDRSGSNQSGGTENPGQRPDGAVPGDEPDRRDEPDA